MGAETFTQAAALMISVWVLLCAVATMAAERVISRWEAGLLAAPANIVAGLLWLALKGTSA